GMRALVHDWRGNFARTDARCADAVAPLFGVERSSEGDDAILRRRVRYSGDRRNHYARNRRDVDNQAAVLLAHGRENGSRAIENTGQIGFDDLAPGLALRVGPRPVRRVRSGAVCQDVDSSERSDGAFGPVANGCLVPNVDRVGANTAPKS